MVERGSARGGCVHDTIKSNAYRMGAIIEAKVRPAKKSVARVALRVKSASAGDSA